MIPPALLLLKGPCDPFDPAWNWARRISVHGHPDVCLSGDRMRLCPVMESGDGGREAEGEERADGGIGSRGAEAEGEGVTDARQGA